MPTIVQHDSEEIAEWIEAFDQVLRDAGPGGARELLMQLAVRARNHGISCAALLNTPYCNTISPDRQAPYPGNLALERKITAVIRWNALAMVMRSNRESSELGGHLASYASSADLFEVGFNHFFRGNLLEGSSGRSSDLVFFQPHSAPGVYARAYVEGRLTEKNLEHFRSEIGGQGLCSYPHPRLMPDFWEFPTGSMGLGPINAIYQARFMRYLEHRGLIASSARKIWAFVGDGEMDEPESLAGLSVAARERLDNLIFVVNCNLQRLDGPVRGNGSIVQELERLYAGIGWNVIKLLWGSDWDELFARDASGVILKRLEETVDGELQSLAANDAAFNRKHFFSKHPDLEALVSHMSDAQVDRLTRGGHDPIKIYAAFYEAMRHKNQPTVILAQTKKGFGLGRAAEGRMSAHQQKKLNTQALRSFRDRFELPLSDEDLEETRFYRPASDSPEMRYLFACRARLGGSIPRRSVRALPLVAPALSSFADFTLKAEKRGMSTTVAFVRMLTALLKDERIGRRIIPIVADEARTFGMESLFRKIGIYSHCGQVYEPEDQADLLYYKEALDGQILEEGINEAGALSSWIAAGTSYSNHGLAMMPFYIFYSIFGFQRVADLIWAAADSRARGFLLGATSGRTTLSGEGLQHQDGNSHVFASTVPSCRAYDPCFAYELAVILESGMKVMFEQQQDVFYYVTLMNENYVHAAMPECVKEGIVQGMYKIRSGTLADGSNDYEEKQLRVQLLGSGTILREVLAAAELLEEKWGICADVWSVTSFTELRRSALAIERAHRAQPQHAVERSWVEHCLGGTEGPIVAATDYIRTVPDMIRAWVPRRYITLGTDGFGRSDTRALLRRFFEVDHLSVAYAAIHALVDEGQLPASMLQRFSEAHNYEMRVEPPWVDAERDKS
jgi:pyruvate dehydrogenase E1 component